MQSRYLFTYITTAISCIQSRVMLAEYSLIITVYDHHHNINYQETQQKSDIILMFMTDILCAFNGTKINYGAKK